MNGTPNAGAPRDERPKVVVHGHLYQPPREDPWTNEVPNESTAAPFHDWNDRITSECYEPNTRARFGAHAINNYEHISFDVGPTLTAWLETHAASALVAMIDADQQAVLHSGFGTAIAHPYVHAILPLCNDADRTTLIRWGIADFRHRFGRDPLGMWLPETAIDVATLNALADEGIMFTMVAPSQVATTRDANRTEEWRAGPGGGALLRVALTNGRSIAVLAYTGEVSNHIAFGGALNDGTALAHSLANAAEINGIAIAATDMESYGHHHQFGELALAAAIQTLLNRNDVALINANEFVATATPCDGVIIGPSAWSCAHGIERWKSDCGCRMAGPSEHNQAWRAPLRRALDTLRDAAAQLPGLHDDLIDAVVARNAYANVLLDSNTWSSFAQQHVHGNTTRARKWLELQRHLLLMYSSCGWFFDDAAGHETLIVLKHARRAIELVVEIGGPDFATVIEGALAPMHSDVCNIDGRTIWNELAIRSPVA